MSQAVIILEGTLHKAVKLIHTWTRLSIAGLNFLLVTKAFLATMCRCGIVTDPVPGLGAGATTQCALGPRRPTSPDAINYGKTSSQSLQLLGHKQIVY